MDLEFRPPAEADWPAFAAQMQESFIETWPAEVATNMRALDEMARPLAGFAGERLEATGGAYRFQMQVPGATLPCSGITWITVSTRQRRKGVLREMMRRLQETGVSEGEPIAALYAAEGAIYGRFGFGVAARTVHLKVAARELAALPPSPGRVVEISRDEAFERFPPVFALSVANRPGVVLREARWWARILRATPMEGPGWMPARFLVYIDADGRDRGTAIARLMGAMKGLNYAGKARLSDLHAADADASRALWRYAGSFDLVRSVTARMRPADDPLPFLVRDLRQGPGFPG
ncbi:MAG: hypothetical protein QOK05_2327 [Chloroflexota bacterium]|jgi:predicted acetyltransferase|nr:hypothetical protein [Chloroflexota bacterium]